MAKTNKANKKPREPKYKVDVKLEKTFKYPKLMFANRYGYRNDVTIEESKNGDIDLLATLISGTVIMAKFNPNLKESDGVDGIETRIFEVENKFNKVTIEISRTNNFEAFLDIIDHIVDCSEEYMDRYDANGFRRLSRIYRAPGMSARGKYGIRLVITHPIKSEVSDAILAISTAFSIRCNHEYNVSWYYKEKWVSDRDRLTVDLAIIDLADVNRMTKVMDKFKILPKFQGWVGSAAFGSLIDVERAKSILENQRGNHNPNYYDDYPF